MLPALLHRAASSSARAVASAPPASPAAQAALPAAPAPFPVQSGPLGVELASAVRKPGKPVAAGASGDACGPLDADDDEETVVMVDPATGEWGGPTKGGAKPEPTRYGDWERNGRCTDF